MLQNHLIYRLIIINAAFIAATTWALAQGYVAPMFIEDTTRICFIILAVFIVGMVSLFNRATKVTSILNGIKSGEPAKIDGQKFLAKGLHISSIANWLLQLGLLGTVIGIAMSAGAVSSGDLSNAGGAKEMVASLMLVIKAALYACPDPLLPHLESIQNRSMIPTTEQPA